MNIKSLLFVTRSNVFENKFAYLYVRDQNHSAQTSFHRKSKIEYRWKLGLSSTRKSRQVVLLSLSE